MVAMVVGREVTVALENGLHMAPAGHVLDVAKRYGCELLLKKGDRSVDGTSIFELLTLAAEKGSVLFVEARGDRAGEAVDELEQLLAGRLGHR
jgi:phosphocarrier protein HPr